MRILPASLLLLLAAASPLAAQYSRFSLTPVAAWSGSASLLSHTIRINDGTLDYTSRERLTLGSALNLGARLGVQLSPGWTVYLQATSGGSRLDYLLTASQATDSGTVSGQDRRRANDATSNTGTVELARGFSLGPDGTQLELSLGGGLQHLAVSRPLTFCDMPGLCDMPEPFVDHYDIPTALAGLALRRPLSRTLSAELHGSLLVGRVNTENVRIEMGPLYRLYQAPDHQAVRSLRGSFGISWRP